MTPSVKSFHSCSANGLRMFSHFSSVSATCDAVGELKWSATCKLRGSPCSPRTGVVKTAPAVAFRVILQLNQSGQRETI